MCKYTVRYAVRLPIGGRKSTNLHLADDMINGITGEEDELTKLVRNLDTVAAKFGMEISGRDMVGHT